MKTPRQILLARHRDAETKLDKVRERALASLGASETAERRPNGFAAGLIEFLRIPRVAWGSLAAAWLVIVALNLAARETPSVLTLTSADQPSAETLQAVRAQKRLLAELVEAGLPADADVSRPVPRPRSERKPSMTYV